MKIYRGYELMQAIAERKIKEGTEFIFKGEDDYEESVIWNGENIKYKNSNENLLKDIPDHEFIYGTFELIEDEEIDIPNIEELDTHTFDSNIRTITVQNRNKINEIIKMFNQVIKMFNQEIKRTRKEKE